LVRPAWQRPTLPGAPAPSTIGAGGLNFRVRNGNGWFPSAITTRQDTVFGYTFKIGYGIVCIHSASEEKPSTDSYPSAQRITALTPRTDLPRHLQGVLLPRGDGKSHLEGGFALRCFQRLSRPHLATQRCIWRHNWYTSGASIPVLSY
jgi:hypothetical protein